MKGLRIEISDFNREVFEEIKKHKETLGLSWEQYIIYLFKCCVKRGGKSE